MSKTDRWIYVWSINVVILLALIPHLGHLAAWEYMVVSIGVLPTSLLVVKIADKYLYK